ncbi:MAG: DUF4214 domain-containing protein [Sterolibacteriaceae bacterium MAG5]|nr:DUF4214 domain-containing protein [Candidatus Nitricoxidireducens bremensis]
MSILKSLCGLMAAFVIALTAFPGPATAGSNTESIQKLYVVFFNRPADPLGLAFWEAKMEAGTTMAEVASAFSASSEYQSSTAGQSPTNLVAQLYQNLFGRTAEANEVLFWGNRLLQGLETVDSIALTLANTAQGTDATAFANKVIAATAFTTALDASQEIVGYSGDAANAVARTWLTTVTDSADSLTTATGTINTTIVSIVASQGGDTAGAGSPSSAPQGPSASDLAGILDDLSELTEDLKIEEEDNSADYRDAKARIDNQGEDLTKQVGGSISSPTSLYGKVQTLKDALVKATTDAERKQVAEAVTALQAQTQVWTANFGSQWVSTDVKTGAHHLRVRDSLQDINNRVLDKLRTSTRCTTSYDGGSHTYVTRCTSG